MKRLGPALIPFVFTEVVFLALFTLFVHVLVPYAFWNFIISEIVVYSFAKFIYTRFTNAHTIGFSVLLVTAYIMFVCTALNTASYCETSTLYAPVLNNEDASKFYESAKFILRNNWDVPVRYYYGFPYLISALWAFTGVNIISPLLLNVFMTLMAVCMSALIASRIFTNLPNNQRAFISSITMLCTASVSFYIGCGTVLLKEPMVYLGVELAIFSIIGLNERNQTRIRTTKDMILFVIAVAMLFLTRHGAILLMLVGILFFVRRYNYKRVIALMVIGIAGLFATYTIVNNTGERDEDIITGTHLESADYLSDNADGTRKAFNRSMEGYFTFPVWKKTAYLPYTASVQYFIPFYWTRHNSTPYGQAQVYSHFGFFWYVVGGLALFFIIFGHKIKTTPKGLVLLMLIGIVGYIIPAYLFAGSVSRYWLPFTPIYATAAAWVVYSAKEDRNIRNMLKKFMIVYVPLVALVLISCYFITTA